MAGVLAIFCERERVHVERWKVGRDITHKGGGMWIDGVNQDFNRSFFQVSGREREGGVGGTVVHYSAPVGMGWMLAQNHF